MSAIIESLADRETVISDLEEKIRDLESTTPKSVPEIRHERPQNTPPRSRSVGTKQSRTKSLPATPEVAKYKNNPLNMKVVDRQCPERIQNSDVDYGEMQELINTLELANDKLLDDNRMLTTNIITKNSIIENIGSD